MPPDIAGIVKIPKSKPETDRDWDQLFRKLNEALQFNGQRVLLAAATALSTRTGTSVDEILQWIADDGKAEDQRFLPQVSAGNVLSIQDVNPLTASADAVNATISVDAFNLQYGFGQVAYNSGTIVGLSPSTNYFVYTDDANYQGGAVSYLASTVRTDVTAANGRVFVGSIITAISANTAAITAATSANPIVFTTGTTPGWVSANSVTLTALPGDFGIHLNGNDYVITVIDTTHFSIPIDGTLYAAYTTGGLASRVSTDLAGGTGGGGGWLDPYYGAPLP